MQRLDQHKGDDEQHWDFLVTLYYFNEAAKHILPSILSRGGEST